MGEHQLSISPLELADMIGTEDAPFIFDVRRKAAYEVAPRVIASARWRDHLQAHDWASELPKGAPVVVYCVHGHQVSQSAAALLRARGLPAVYLAGGIEAFEAVGGTTMRKAEPADDPGGQPVQWVTGEAPLLGRMACIWLIRRLIDPNASIQAVAEDYVVAAAKELGAQAFAAADTGDLSDFDGLLRHFEVSGQALTRLSAVLQEAERPTATGHADVGLATLWDGLVATAKDDATRLERGLILFDGLYAAVRGEGAGS